MRLPSACSATLVLDRVSVRRSGRRRAQPTTPTIDVDGGAVVAGRLRRGLGRESLILDGGPLQWAGRAGVAGGAGFSYGLGSGGWPDWCPTWDVFMTTHCPSAGRGSELDGSRCRRRSDPLIVPTTRDRMPEPHGGSSSAVGRCEACAQLDGESSISGRPRRVTAGAVASRTCFCLRTRSMGSSAASIRGAGGRPVVVGRSREEPQVIEVTTPATRRCRPRSTSRRWSRLCGRCRLRQIRSTAGSVSPPRPLPVGTRSMSRHSARDS